MSVTFPTEDLEAVYEDPDLVNNPVATPEEIQVYQDALLKHSRELTNFLERKPSIQGRQFWKDARIGIRPENCHTLHEIIKHAAVENGKCEIKEWRELSKKKGGTRGLYWNTGATSSTVPLWVRRNKLCHADQFPGNEGAEAIVNEAEPENAIEEPAVEPAAEQAVGQVAVQAFEPVAEAGPGTGGPVASANAAVAQAGSANELSLGSSKVDSYKLSSVLIVVIQIVQFPDV